MVIILICLVLFCFPYDSKGWRFRSLIENKDSPLLLILIVVSFGASLHVFWRL